MLNRLQFNNLTREVEKESDFNIVELCNLWEIYGIQIPKIEKVEICGIIL